MNSEENTELMDPSTNELPAEKEFFFERIPAKVSPIKCEKIRTKSDGCVCQLLAGSFEKYFLIFLNIPPFKNNLSSCEDSSNQTKNRTASFSSGT